MSTQVQYRRGTNAQNDAFTGALAEITVDTTNKTLRVHDGITAGGFSLAGTTATQTLTNKTLSSVTITGTVTGNIIPSANVTYNLGNSTNRFNDLYLANSTIYLGSAQISANATSLTLTNPGGGTTVLSGASPDIQASTVSASGNVTGGNVLTAIVSASGNVTGANYLTAGLISASGNITGNYILGNGSLLTGIDATSIQSGTSNVKVVSSGGNVSVGVGGTSNVAVWATTGEYITGVMSASGNVTGGNITTAGLISATGNITSGNVLTGIVSASGNVTGANYLTAGLISATGNITSGNLSVGTGTVTFNNVVNGGASATGNIGTTALPFNTVFAKATSAQYADVAERYRSDTDYAVGTVLIFGGSAEVTQSKKTHDTAIAGTVSENPAYIMNTGLESKYVATVALLGRVPCRVIGPIQKGDLLAASHAPGIATALNQDQYQPGCVIGKALENYDSNTEGLIEIVVGRL